MTLLRPFAGAVLLAGAALALVVADEKSTPAPAPAATPASTPAAESAALPAARQQARLAHQIYAASLDVIHERYFRDDRSTVPARALEDVFSEVARQTRIDARWIGVNARTMSINHEPKDDFEKAAAKAIAGGKREYEAVENGVYRRAEAVPLAVGCLTCHGSFGMVPKTPRFAALVVKMPLEAAVAPVEPEAP